MNYGLSDSLSRVIALSVQVIYNGNMNLSPMQFSAVLSAAVAAAALPAYFSFRKGYAKALKSLDRVFDAIPDLVLVIDKDYNIVKVNRKMLQALGLTREEVEGRKCYAILHKTDAPRANCPCAMARRDNRPRATEIVDDVLGMLVEASCFPILDGRGAPTGALHIIKDLSSRKDHDGRLSQAGKMEALGRLAGGLAHEFNNILSIISSAFYMLRGRLDGSEAADEDVAAIQKAVVSASELTRHLLALSQRQVMDMKPADLNAIIKESAQMTRKLLGEETRIETILKSGLPPVSLDPAQFNKLLMNIIARAEPPSGAKRSIELKTENLVLNDLSARAPGDAAAGNFVRITLKDTAYRIKREFINRLFEPYFEPRSMNLAIAYNIARQHKGWIDAVGDEDGVTFEIYLPAAPATGPAAAAQAPAPEIHPRKALCILLAEDDEDLRVLTARALRKNGHEVFEADCAEKALKIFASRSGAFDTLISDVVMPDKSGVSLADDIREIKPQIDIVLMSGYIDDKVDIDKIEKKGYKFIYKPFDVDALLTMLRF